MSGDIVLVLVTEDTSTQLSFDAQLGAGEEPLVQLIARAPGRSIIIDDPLPARTYDAVRNRGLNLASVLGVRFIDEAS